MAKRKTALKAKRASNESVKKAAVTAGVVLVLGASNLYAKPQFILGLYPNTVLPLSMGNFSLAELSKQSGKTPYGVGVTGRFTVRPIPMIDLFAEGTYNYYTYPFYDGQKEKQIINYNIRQINVSGGAGYNFQLSDRFNLNTSLKAGASWIDNKPTLAFGATIGFTYRVRPAVSLGTNVSGEFNGPQIIPVSINPGIVMNLSETFNKSSNLYIEVMDQQPVFPVLYSWYENNPFGTVRIANMEDATIKNIKVSFYQPQYMNQPNLCAEMDILGREEYFDADLTAFFNERMLELTELTDTQSSIIIEYTYLGQKRRKEYPIVIPVYDRNSMNWADDRRAASFVSSKDPAAMWFSKYVTSIVRDNIRSGVPINVQYAMGIFETLDQFGINYVIDPSSAYSDNIGGESVDFLQFPYQTLMYRGGDCDDLSILVCSLFEAVGIKTAFITVPGHIYMAFDTGLSKEEALNQFSDPSQLIFRDNQVWMPLEVTISDEGFMKAWRVGAREWNVAAAEGTAAIFPTQESWEIYRPVSVPGAEAKFDMPDKRIVAKLFEHRIDEWVMREIDPLVRDYKNALARHYDEAVQNNLGVLYSRYGLFSEAENQFKVLRKKGYIPAVINTANVYFAKKSFNKALASYKAVLREEPLNSLAVLGAARSQWELGNFRECDRYYEQLQVMNPDLASEYKYLVSFTDTKGRAYNLADRLETMAWSVQKSEAMSLREEDLQKIGKLNTDPDEEYELPPLNLNDENRFEMDNVKEPEKRDIEAEIALEEKEETEARNENIDDFEKNIAVIGALVTSEIQKESEEENDSEEFESKLADGVGNAETAKVDEIPLNVETSTNAETVSSNESAKVAELAANAEPTKVAELAENAETSTNAETSSSAESPANKASAKVAELAENVETSTSFELPANAETVSSIESAKVAELAKNAETSTNAETLTNSETSERVESAKVAELAENAETSTNAETSSSAESPANKASAKVDEIPANVETLTNSETSERVEFSKVAELAENVETVSSIESAKVAELAANVETSTSSELPANVETVSSIESAKVAELAENVETSTNAESTSSAESPANKASANVSEFSSIPSDLMEVDQPDSLFAGDLPDFLFTDLTTLELDKVYEESEEEMPEEKVLSAIEAEIKPAPVEKETTLVDAWMKLPAKKEPVKEDAPVVDRVIPRFTESPSAEWAPEEAFSIAVIPGMRSFDEEMGNTQNEKAFLFKEDKLENDNVENFDIFHDDEDSEILVKQETVEAVNPFGSYFDDDLIEEASSAVFVKNVTKEKSDSYETALVKTSENSETQIIENHEDRISEIVNEKTESLKSESLKTESGKSDLVVQAKDEQPSFEVSNDNQSRTDLPESAEVKKSAETQISAEESKTEITQSKNKKRAGVFGAVALVLVSGVTFVLRKRKETKQVEGK